MLADILVLALVVLIVGAAAGYILRQKKKGVKCIGCPAGAADCGQGGCGGSCAGCSGACGKWAEP